MKQTILYIDADPDTIPLVHWALANLTREMIWVDNGPRGLELAQQQRPDLILVSVDLSGSDGLEVIRQLRALAGSMHIVALGTRGQYEQRERALEAGADSFIPKPLDLRALWRHVNALLSD